MNFQRSELSGERSRQSFFRDFHVEQVITKQRIDGSLGNNKDIGIVDFPFHWIPSLLSIVLAIDL